MSTKPDMPTLSYSGPLAEMSSMADGKFTTGNQVKQEPLEDQVLIEQNRCDFLKFFNRKFYFLGGCKY